VAVENRPGASSAIAIERGATSPADGYTLLLLMSGATVLPALRKLPVDLEGDLAPVSLVAIRASLLVVHPSVPARSVRELIALARSQPGKLSYGSAGVGSSAYLATELFNSMVKVNIVHVPYKGGAESAVATAAGHTDMAITDFTAARPLIEAGKLRALATVGGKRLSSMPSIPTPRLTMRRAGNKVSAVGGGIVFEIPSAASGCNQILYETPLPNAKKSR
jgi:tripartite-type tricarboxylate transporter receptor subunit TctC